MSLPLEQVASSPWPRTLPGKNFKFWKAKLLFCYSVSPRSADWVVFLFQVWKSKHKFWGWTNALICPGNGCPYDPLGTILSPAVGPICSCSVPRPPCSSLVEPQLQFWSEGCCLYYTGIFTLTSLSFEHHLNHSYLGLKLRWERFGFPWGNKLYLIPAEEILYECLVSFVLLLMKYSCFINKLSCL